MNLRSFALERYFAKYEFTAQFLLSSSDCDGLSMADLLARADPSLREAWADLTLGYTESPGLPQLRQEVARLYAGIRPEEILIMAPEEGIFVAMNCLLAAGDHVVCTAPGYQSLYEIAQGLGCDVSRWTPREDEGWKFRVEDVKALIRPTTRLLVVNFPHNPTGALPARKDFEAVVNLAKSRGLHFFSDEMYRFLEFNAAARLPSACELYEKGITLFGMSKTFGMAGVRIGWLATHDLALRDKMAAFKDYTTICNSAPSEWLALIALRRREEIIETHRRRIQRNLKVLDAFFKQQPARFSWVPPKAGTVCFPRLLQDGAEKFCDTVVRQAGILILPSSVYDYGDAHIRIGLGRENFPVALQKFEAFLEEIP